MTDLLEEGKLVYADRSYIFASPIPDRHLKQTYILTKNGDKDTTGTGFLSFDVDQKVVVFVAIDERMSAPPNWLTSWDTAADRLVTSDTGGSGRKIYFRKFPKGKVSLGANRDSGMPKGRSMYTVVIVPQMTGVDRWPSYAEGKMQTRTTAFSVARE